MEFHNNFTYNLGFGIMNQDLYSFIPYTVVTLLAVAVFWSQSTQPNDLLNP